MAEASVIVCPGDRLAAAGSHISGRGTYVSGDFVYASVAGTKQLVPATAGAADSRPTLEVVSSSQRPAVPAPGDIVTCKVTRVTQRLASADILCIGAKALEDGFAGIIRLQDVRATEIDKVDLFACFRPGDVVRAEVVSLGDSRSYYLSTARNELGVVHAKSSAGVPMVPVSWTEMQCPQTLAIEQRKVAKAL